ncbi:hypothetical protein F4780DRAFT_792770 [Xylariomycetidae sp. FL0641]|nr:hypothetical protein F4780DRAFT_792770 [Xylariomycetidae sp. FL0641]
MPGTNTTSSSSSTSSTGHWLDRYGTGFHAWRASAAAPGTFTRPCGLVEAGFDADGRYFEGRADISGLLSAHVSAPPSRARMLLAFALLRLRHPLLLARAELRGDPPDLREPWFAVAVPPSPDAAVRDAADLLTTVGGGGGGRGGGGDQEEAAAHFDADDFYAHAQNAARVFDPARALARAYVLPPCAPARGAEDGEDEQPQQLRVLFVLAHQIADGLSARAWTDDFVQLLNHPPSSLRRRIAAACGAGRIRARLPPAQEDLYAPVGRTAARRRWFWALAVVLRYVARRPPPEAFPNPLRRRRRRRGVVPLPLPPAYPDAFDYGRTPPLNTRLAAATLSRAASRRLRRLCREARCSVGAGCFVLVGMAMMALHEELSPARAADGEEEEEERRPFVGHFPLNPRPFLGTACTDSVMLAFSEGVVLPFLPAARLGVEARFRLLARLAHRQLGAFQKRAPAPAAADGGSSPVDNPAAALLRTRGLTQLLATNYMDRYEKLVSSPPLPFSASTLASRLAPASASASAPRSAGAVVRAGTCGVSSIGRVSWTPPPPPPPRNHTTTTTTTKAGEGEEEEEEEDRLTVRGHALRNGVRAREGEFLVAVAGDAGDDGVVRAEASYDACAIDEALAPRWVRCMEGLLEPEGGAGEEEEEEEGGEGDGERRRRERGGMVPSLL